MAVKSALRDKQKEMLLHHDNNALLKVRVNRSEGKKDIYVKSPKWGNPQGGCFGTPQSTD